ncbi:hypothetical protein [Algoriphagus namhaensis]
MKITLFALCISTFFSLGFPGSLGVAYSQAPEITRTELVSATVQYQNLFLKKVVSTPSEAMEETTFDDLKSAELTFVEQSMAEDLGSHWAWAEHTLDMIDSYSPFLFRTKKSRELEEVKLILQVDELGRVSGFEVLTDMDKGLKERLDHMIRKLPDCKPVPGFTAYTPEAFELTITKQ